MYMYIHAQSLSHVWLSVTLWTVAHQAPLSMEFSTQEYWSSLPCPPPGGRLESGIEPASHISPALAGRFFTTSNNWEALSICMSEWVKLLSSVWLFATPWTVAPQAPPSMGFFRQEYWSGLPLNSYLKIQNTQKSVYCMNNFWIYKKGAYAQKKNEKKYSKILTVLLGTDGWLFYSSLYISVFSKISVLNICNQETDIKKKTTLKKMNPNGKGVLNSRWMRADPCGSCQTHTVSKIQKKTNKWGSSRGMWYQGQALLWWVLHFRGACK